MNTTITSEGVLTIKAETQLDAYAMSAWAKDNPPNGNKMIFDMNVAEEPEFYQFKPSKSSGKLRACSSIGPQPGQTKCPCMLRNEK